MTTFDDRERAFEQKFVHDEEMHFRALARRNKLLALWAADQLGLSMRDADAYLRQTIETVLMPDGDDRLAAKIGSDLGAVSSEWTELRVRELMAEFMAKAVTDVQLETI